MYLVSYGVYPGRSMGSFSSGCRLAPGGNRRAYIFRSAAGGMDEIMVAVKRKNSLLAFILARFPVQSKKGYCPDD